MSRITDLSTSVYESFAMLAGMQLDLFSLLADDPQTVGELASHLNVRSDKLAILCYALVATELLTVSDDRFSNTDESDRFLVRDKPEFLGDRHHIWSRIWPATMQAAESIRTGKPQAHLDFSSISDDEQIEFFSGLHPASISGGREFAAACDLSQHRSMVDVGGGSGGFTLGLIEKWSHLQATVVDLPHITTVTRRFIEEAGATDKITIVGADLVTEPCPDSLTDTLTSPFSETLSRSSHPMMQSPPWATSPTRSIQEAASTSPATSSTTPAPRQESPLLSTSSSSTSTKTARPILNTSTKPGSKKRATQTSSS